MKDDIHNDSVKKVSGKYDSLRPVMAAGRNLLREVLCACRYAAMLGTHPNDKLYSWLVSIVSLYSFFIHQSSTWRIYLLDIKILVLVWDFCVGVFHI